MFQAGDMRKVTNLLGMGDMNENEEDKQDSREAVFFRNHFSWNNLYMLTFEFGISKPVLIVIGK